MPTSLQIAQDRERRKLAQAGLNPDGTPVGGRVTADQSGTDDDDDDRDDGGDPGELRHDDGAPPDGDLRTQIADLTRQLAALQGRVAPAQRDAQDFRALWQTERDGREAERAQLQARIAALEEQQNTKPFTVDDLLTDDEKRDIDPLVLSAITKIAEAAAKRNAPRGDTRADVLAVLEDREAQRVVQHRAKVLSDPTRGLHQLAQLAYDPEFIKWSQEDDNDVDSVVTSLMSAKSTEEVDRYAKIVSKRITAFRNRKPGQPTDPRRSLSGHMRRGDKAQLTEAERNAKIIEAKQLSRSRNPADRQRANEILNSLN